MRIHGLRFYPQSTKVLRAHGARIFVHRHVSEDCTDFFYIFRPLASIWHGHLFAQTFAVGYDVELNRKDPMPALRGQYESSLLAAHVDSQLMLLRGEDFTRWGASMHFDEGAFLPIFRRRPTFETLEALVLGSRIPLELGDLARRVDVRLAHVGRHLLADLYHGESGPRRIASRAFRRPEVENLLGRF